MLVTLSVARSRGGARRRCPQLRCCGEPRRPGRAGWLSTLPAGARDEGSLRQPRYVPVSQTLLSCYLQAETGVEALLKQPNILSELCW